MMEAVVAGRVLARSEDTVVVEGNHYFPSATASGLFKLNQRPRFGPFQAQPAPP